MLLINSLTSCWLHATCCVSPNYIYASTKGNLVTNNSSDQTSNLFALALKFVFQPLPRSPGDFKANKNRFDLCIIISAGTGWGTRLWVKVCCGM